MIMIDSCGTVHFDHTLQEWSLGGHLPMLYNGSGWLVSRMSKLRNHNGFPVITSEYTSARVRTCLDLINTKT